VTARERKTAAKRVTVRDFAQRKGRGEKLVVVTAYDALFGRLVDEAGVDCVLVGDSLGNVLAGHDSTLPVTLAHMIYHAAMVRRGVSRALVVVDMPFLTYQAGADRAVLNCGRVLQRTGCHAVKMEGGNADMAEVVRRVVSAGIPVMGHVGFTPQSVNTLGGYRVQGKDSEGAARLLDEARALEDAGVFSIVLELVPAAVAARITEAVSVPTIGIGAGAGCDGQVLVLQDLLGLNDLFAPKFLKRYANLADDVRTAVNRFVEDVRGGRYPSREHEF
jgi:3-methyl-2-oxobutanoate hydroxymethyltransferase